MKKLQLNISGDEDEDMLIAEGDDTYNDLKKAMNDLLIKTRRGVRNNATYKEVKKAIDACIQWR